MQHRHQQAPTQQCAEFTACHAAVGSKLVEHCRRHEHDSDARGCKPFVDGHPHVRPQLQSNLAEPDRHLLAKEQVVELRRVRLAIRSRVAEKHVMRMRARHNCCTD